MNYQNVAIMLAIPLLTCFGLTTAQAQDVTGDIDCKEIGRNNGEVQYQYDVTLVNNTESKLIVEYNVIFLTGNVPTKNHAHSTLIIANERLTETHDGTMNETDWDKVTKFRVELSWKKK
jgi:hypothetical protein